MLSRPREQRVSRCWAGFPGSADSSAIRVKSSTPGVAVTTPFGLGDGCLSYQPGVRLPTLSYQYVIEPLDAGVVIEDIVSAKVSIMVEDANNAFNIAIVTFEGGQGFTATGGIQVAPFKVFSLFERSVAGIISVADGALQIDAYGLNPYQILAQC